jgi:hypothetical protein
MDSPESGTPAPLAELSDSDRVRLYDQAVVPLFQTKGKEIKPTDLPGYRYFATHSPEAALINNSKLLNKLYKLFKGGFTSTALMNIREHPEVLSLNRKVHLQPKSEDLLKVMVKLAEVVSSDDEIYNQVYGFKVINRSTHLKFPSPQPAVVIYLRTDGNLEQVADSFAEHLAGFEPAQAPPRYNQQVGSSIVFSVVGDGSLKDHLNNQRMLDRYYDPANNFSRPRADVQHFSPSPLDRAKRSLEERIATTFVK